MPDDKPIDPRHEQIRNVLRIVGPVLLGLGALLMIVGLADVFCVMASDSMDAWPTLFWCFFAGMPLLFVGLVMTKAAYMGRIARYFSQEMTPAATDTFNYAARQTKDGIREVASAIGEGLRGTGGGSEVRVRCHKCNHDNDADAKFCSNCGAALAKTAPCPDCHELNDPDARFCDHCGRAM